MSNTKRDKYDEVAKKCDELAHADYPTWQRQRLIKEYLCTTFPSAPSVAESAEDARELAEKYSDAEGCMISTIAIEKLAAEIESFARSRVKPWREHLRWAHDCLEILHCPAKERLAQIEKLLSADDAKEAAK